jgi:hypothetical protein
MRLTILSARTQLKVFEPSVPWIANISLPGGRITGKSSVTVLATPAPPGELNEMYTAAYLLDSASICNLYVVLKAAQTELFSFLRPFLNYVMYNI